MSAKQSIKQRLEKYTERIPFSDCEYWTGARNGGGRKHDQHRVGGRGHLKVNGRMVTATRLVYEEYIGTIPEGQHVLHTCGQGHHGCIAAHHLYLGTDKDNAEDREKDDTNLRGERNSSAKLTVEQVIELRQLASEGWSGSQLGKRFNINKRTATRIVSGQLWRHVPF